jgi:hypothetical protein
VRRYVKVWLVAAVSAVLGMSLAPQAAAAQGNYVMIINDHSGLCATMFDDGGAQWPCDFSDPWEMFFQGGDQYSIINYFSGKCLTVQGGSIQANAKVVEGTCNASIANLWRKTQVRPGDFHFVNVNSNMCLTVAGASLEPGARLIQFPCNTTAPHNETWNTFPVFIDDIAETGHGSTG